MERKILVILFSIFTLCTTGIVHSQMDSNKFNNTDTTIVTQIDTILQIKKNTVFAEIGGNGIIYSINYDRLFDVSEKIKLSSRIGIHYTNSFPLQYYKTLCIPVEFSGLYSISGQKHFLEVGLGFSYLNNYDRVTKHA